MFSVIIPVYNKANTLRASIESVLSQTFKDFELIIVNDGSTDGFFDAVKDYDSIVVMNKENGGVSTARNTGILNGKGHFVCFLDADDTWEPNHLEVLSQVIPKYPDAGMYCTSFKTILPNGSERISNKNLKFLEGNSIQINEYFEFSMKTKDEILHTNSICIKKSALDSTGLFEEGISIGEDTDLWLRVAAYYPVVLSSDCTTTYNRELSTLTRYATFNYDWVFAKRKQSLLSDHRISKSQKKYILKTINIYTISKCRHKLLENKRKEAFHILLEVDKPIFQLSSYLVTLVCFLIPNRLLNKLYNGTKTKKYFSDDQGKGMLKTK